MSQGKGSKRRLGKPGAYEAGWERVFGRRRDVVEQAYWAGEIAKAMAPLNNALKRAKTKVAKRARLDARTHIDLEKPPVEDVAKCGGRSGCTNLPHEEHTCPFAEEIGGSDRLCTCCSDCTHECAMDI